MNDILLYNHIAFERQYRRFSAVKAGHFLPWIRIRVVRVQAGTICRTMWLFVINIIYCERSFSERLKKWHHTKYSILGGWTSYLFGVYIFTYVSISSVLHKRILCPSKRNYHGSISRERLSERVAIISKSIKCKNDRRWFPAWLYVVGPTPSCILLLFFLFSFFL